MTVVFQKLGQFFSFAANFMNYKVFGDISLMQLFAPMFVIVLVLGVVSLVAGISFTIGEGVSRSSRRLDAQARARDTEARAAERYARRAAAREMRRRK